MTEPTLFEDPSVDWLLAAEERGRLAEERIGNLRCVIKILEMRLECAGLSSRVDQGEVQWPELARDAPPASPDAAKRKYCSDCPPPDYPTDKTRCDECPFRSAQ